MKFIDNIHRFFSRNDIETTSSETVLTVKKKKFFINFNNQIMEV
jgi:hypothetical protein